MEKTVEQIQAELAAAQAAVKEAEAKAADAEAKLAAEAKAKADAEAERIALEEKHKGTLAANARLAESKESKSEEINKLHSDMEIVKKLLEADAAAKAAAQEEIEKAKKSAEKDLIEKSLESAGFKGTDLLVGKFGDIEIENGKIKGFDEKVEALKSEYPELYIDGAAQPSTGTSATFKKETDMVTYLSNVESKLKDGEILGKDEFVMTLFGNKK